MIFNPIYGSGGSSPSPALGTKNITANGTYNASADNLDGYSQVTVNVSGSPNLQAKTGLSITANGSFSYTPDAGYDGLSEVSGAVNVSGGGSSWTQPTPTNYDSSAGYPNGGGAWMPSSSGNVRTDVYQVSAGKVYYFTTTSVVGNRYRVAFFTNNPVVDGSGAGGIDIYINHSDCPTDYPLVYLARSNGYIAINKTANGVNNLVVKFYETDAPA